MNIVDLHVHSIKSDGSFTPTELVQYAIEKGLSAFALTDHDTTAGLAEAMSAAEGKPIEVIPGIEFSTEYEGRDIHILGLYVDYEEPHFKEHLVTFQESRVIRNEKMCKLLSDAGMDITYDALLAAYPGSVITRAHYAKYLLAHGYIKSMKEAFDRYIGDNCPYFVPREKVTPSQAVELILQAHGIPILAHPTLYHMGKDRLDKLVDTLTESGLMGIEAVYSTYCLSEECEMKALAKKYSLCISGGSDFHGNTKPGLDLAVGYGKLFIPEEILTNLKQARRLKYPDIFTDMDLSGK
ncbi:MAG: PHP domain-containing protein [Lachnospiraceae bacterium]|nr:PHP domain-containing protein [Lachnospiraceae bacterium]